MNRLNISGVASRRRGRAARVGLEALEGRIALSGATTALDRAFAGRGVVLGTPDTGSGPDLSITPVVTSTADGKVVAVGVYQKAPLQEGSSDRLLAVRRFNADGSADATFGTGGQASVALPAGFTLVNDQPRDVVVLGDGSILFAACLLEGPDSNTLVTQSVVFKLDATGQPDAGFGTGGTTVLPQSAGFVSSLTTQADGKVVAAGEKPTNNSNGTRTYAVTVTRLTTAGLPDATFNGTGELGFAPFQLGTFNYFQRPRVAQTPTGQILVSGAVDTLDSSFNGTRTGLLARITSAGTLDPTFGISAPSGGQSGYTIVGNLVPEDLDVAPDGKVYLSGVTNFENGSPFLTRLLPDGTVDTTFKASFFEEQGRVNLGQGSFPAVLGADGTVTTAGVYTGSNTNISTFYVKRFLGDGSPDTSFGTRGRFRFDVQSPLVNVGEDGYSEKTVDGLALAADGSILLGGTVISSEGFQSVVARLLPVAVRANTGDYDADGVADPAILVRTTGTTTIRPSNGTDAVLEDQSFLDDASAIPAPGDYDGDGVADAAFYFQSTGSIYIQKRSSFGSFGAAGVGQSIPAPGDYDGDGVTDLAVYMPAYAVLAYRPSTGGPDVLTSFGNTGVDQTIPAPGDYDGDGKDDVAAYLPQYGVLAYRPSSGGADVYVGFGQPGNRATIPAPGDYDGDGVTDVAAYLPQYAIFAYRPSASPGGPDVLGSFGAVGVGQSIPAPGDYDGDGKADLAVYLPQFAIFAYRPSGSPGTGDVLQTFGAPGTGVTTPSASISYAQPPTVSGMALAGPRAEPGILLAISDDDLASIAGKPRTRRI